MKSKSIPQGKPDLQIVMSYDEACSVCGYLVFYKDSYPTNTITEASPTDHLRMILEGHVQNDL